MHRKSRATVHVWRRRRAGAAPKSPEAIPSDVLGSYTGTPETADGDQVPVQDADDL